MSAKELQDTIEKMAISRKGILAADESTPTIGKRFKTINVESTEESRRSYRETLFATEGLGDYICGVILFEETLGQPSSNGVTLGGLLEKRGMIPGIKVDKGLTDLAHAPGEKVTQGLDGLSDRLAGYKEQGARFAKWRAVYSVTDSLPSRHAIETNAECLARYAAICQEHGIVPIVEPEVLMDGSHDLARSEAVHEAVLHEVFHALHRHGVVLEHIILKPSMVISGSENSNRASVQEVAEATVRVLRRTVPAAVPTINFLSGGQGDEEATAHLNAMNALDVSRPWVLSFSYGRALQAPALSAWGGKAENVANAQKALHHRAKMNAAATVGEYSDAMEVGA